MNELESVIEKKLIDQLCCGESQWTYRPDIRTEEQLWDNFKYILEQNNKARLNDAPLSESEFAKIKNDLSHASFYEAGELAFLVKMGKYMCMCSVEMKRYTCW